MRHFIYKLTVFALAVPSVTFAVLDEGGLYITPGLSRGAVAVPDHLIVPLKTQRDGASYAFDLRSVPPVNTLEDHPLGEALPTHEVHVDDPAPQAMMPPDVAAALSKEFEYHPPSFVETDFVISEHEVSDKVELNKMFPALPTHPLSMHEAIILALRYNPNVKNAETQRIADKWSLYSAQYEFYPQLKVTASDTYAKTGGMKGTHSISAGESVSLALPIGTSITASQSNAISDTGFYTPTASITVSQPLLRGFGRDINLTSLRNAEESEISARLTFKDSVISIVNTVISDYTALIVANYNVETAQTSLKNNEETVAQTKAQIAIGQKAEVDVLQAESAVSDARGGLINTKNNARNAEQRLLTDLGLSPYQHLLVHNQISVEKPDLPSPEESIQIALHNNISYLKSKLALKSTERSTLRSVDSARWGLDLSGSLSFGSSPAKEGLSNVTNGQIAQSVTLSLDAPIFDVPRESSAISAQVSLEQARRNFFQQKLDLISSVRQSWDDVWSAYRRVQDSRRSVELSEQNLAAQKERLRVGLISTFEITTHIDNLVSRRVSLIQSESSYITSLVSFYNLLGITLDKWDIDLVY